mgnify:CR=1 FL=1
MSPSSIRRHRGCDLLEFRGSCEGVRISIAHESPILRGDGRSRGSVRDLIPVVLTSTTQVPPTKILVPPFQGPHLPSIHQ